MLKPLDYFLICLAVALVVAFNIEWAPIGAALWAFIAEAFRRLMFLAMACVIGGLGIICGIGACRDNAAIGGALIGTGIGPIIVGLYILFTGEPPH